MSEPARADSVGERLRNLRHGLGLSQEQLARRLGVSFVTVNRWESGKTQISAKAAVALAGLQAGAAVGETNGEGTALPVAGSSFRRPRTRIRRASAVYCGIRGSSQSVPSRSIPPSHDLGL